MTSSERIELKEAICKIAATILDIDARIEPTLQDRITVLRKKGCTDQDVQDMYDQYIEELAEECIKQIES